VPYSANVARSVSFAGTSRFKLIRLLGAGGMGVVYEALDRERNVKVALKTLRSLSGDSLLRFKQEFREFQNLHHDHLVEMHELFFDEGEWFFTMELLAGVDFITWVRPRPDEDAFPADVAPAANLETQPTITAPGLRKRRGELDEARLRAALPQLVSGILALHEAGKIHRDLKPSNVLVQADGKVVLLDFGLATEALRQRQEKSSNDIVGTVEYMAPEQASGRFIGPEADWYSLGVMLYEALTAQVPVTGHALEIMMAKQRLDSPSPRQIVPDAPRDLSELTARLLAFNPAARPGGRELLDKLGKRPSGPRPALTRSSVAAQNLFVGREGELGLLADKAIEARHGTVAVAIVGESGIGKSALARRFTEALQRDDASVVVLWGACYEAENVPFKAIDGLVDSLSAAMRKLSKVDASALLPRRAHLLARVFPVLLRVEAIAEAPRTGIPLLDPPEERRQLFAAFRELLGRLADRRRVVLVIDDLQWADSDSLAMLRELLRQPEAPNLLLLATVRDVQSEEPAAVLLPELERLELPRLGLAEASELAATLLRRIASEGPDRSAHIAREAGGHPLFIDEMVRYLALETGPALPGQLEEALWARVCQLDPAARRIVEICCLASGPIAQQLVAQAAGLSFGEFTQHASLLRVAHFLRTTGMRATDLAEPYHGRVRAAVLEKLSPEEAQGHHHRLAVALEMAGGHDAASLTAHWLAAGDVVKAGHYSALAAEKAARALAFDRAAQFYQLCLRLSSEPLLAFRIGLAEALANAGRGGEAGRVFLQAAEQAGPGEAVDLRRRAAAELLRSGHLDEGLAAIDTVLVAVGLELPRTPKAALASLLMRRATVRLRGLRFKERDATQVPQEQLALIDTYADVSSGLAIVDTIRGADFQARSLIASLRAGEPTRLVRALAMEVAYLSINGPKVDERNKRLLGVAREIIARRPHAQSEGLVVWAAGMSAFLGGRWALGRRLQNEAEKIFRERCTGATWELDTARFIGLWAAFYEGDVVALRDEVPRLLRESEARGDRYAATNVRTAFSPFLALCADEPARALADVDEALAAWSRQGFHIQHMNGLLAKVQTALYQGAPSLALELLDGQAKQVRASLLLSVQQIRVRMTHLRGCAHLALGQSGEALKLARSLEGEKVPWATALATTLRAGHQRRETSASPLYADAIGALDTCGMQLYAAAARLRFRPDDEFGRATIDKLGIVNVDALSAMLVP
jgi:hypothetical protein